MSGLTQSTRCSCLIPNWHVIAPCARPATENFPSRCPSATYQILAQKRPFRSGTKTPLHTNPSHVQFPGDFLRRGRFSELSVRRTTAEESLLAGVSRINPAETGTARGKCHFKIYYLITAGPRRPLPAAVLTLVGTQSRFPLQ